MVPDDLRDLKRAVGMEPFAARIQLSEDGFAKCPFHNGDSDKSFHIVQLADSVFIGTCFSECEKKFDVIDFVARFDGLTRADAIKKLESQEPSADAPKVAVREKPEPMTAAVWSKAKLVTDADAARLAASRPDSLTPSAATLNAMGFRIKDNCLGAPFRLGGKFYTVKVRSLREKEFFQAHSVSQRGLFNIDAVTPGCDVYVVESELDAAILHEIGLIAVSVVNASQKRMEPEVLEKLLTAKRIFMVGDQDAPGQKCMTAIGKWIPKDHLYRITFGDAKDIGELAQSAKRNLGLLGTFKEQFRDLIREAAPTKKMQQEEYWAMRKKYNI